MISHDKQGRIIAIRCKLCQELIAEVPKGSNTTKLVRFGNYAEAKFQLDSGGFHVTHGCRNCLKPRMSKQHMAMCYGGDLPDRALVNKPVKLVALDYEQKGIP